MKDEKWSSVVVLIVVVAAIVIMFSVTNDQAIQNHLVGYLDVIVPFVVGAGSGGAVGFWRGFAKGKGILT